MANLNSDLQASISALGTQHTNLVQAVRDYKDGSVASATNDLLEARDGVIASVQAKETSLLGLIDGLSGSKSIPAVLADFSRGIYMTGENNLRRGVDRDDLFTVYRTTDTYIVNSSGYYEKVAPATYAEAFDPVTNRSLGFQSESPGTNILEETHDMSGWVTYEPLSIAPTTEVSGFRVDGQVHKVTVNTVDSTRTNKVIHPNINMDEEGNRVTASIFVKKGSMDGASIMLSNGSVYLNYCFANIDFSTGEIVSDGKYGGSTSSVRSGVVPHRNGWYRIWVSSLMLDSKSTSWRVTCSLLKTPTSRNPGNTKEALALTDYMYMADAQLEVFYEPTSIIPTYGSSVTRGATSLYSDYVKEIMNTEEGTMYFELGSLVYQPDLRYFYRAVSARGVMFARYSGEGNIYLGILTKDSEGDSTRILDIYNYDDHFLDSDESLKVVFRYSRTAASIWVNGVVVVSDETVDYSRGDINQFAVSIAAALTTPMFSYYTRALTDAEVEGLYDA